MRWTTVFVCSERCCWRHHTSNASSFNIGSSSFLSQIFSVCWYTRGSGKGITRQGLSSKLCFFDNFQTIYGFSLVPFLKYLSIQKRQLIIHCARICFFSAPHYGISHNNAYQIMKTLTTTRPRDYVVIIPCMLVGKDGREKAIVCFPGSETSLLRERQERIRLGWKA